MQPADVVTSLFRSRGLRVTPQRQAIFALLEGDETHPTIDALYERARIAMPSIALKTVYQTVHDLAALGEVSILDLGTGSFRVDPNVEREHHHLVCSECGDVRDLPIEFSSLRVPARYRRGFAVDTVQVIFRGRCDDCASRSPQHITT